MKKAIKAIAIISALCVLLAAVWFLFGKTYIQKKAVVISSRSYEITGEMLAYCIDEQAAEYANYYSSYYGDDYITSIGLDITKSLKSQKSGYGGTWYDYFYGLAIENIKETLSLCEAAADEAFTEPEEIDKLKTRAGEEACRAYSESAVYAVLRLEAYAESYSKAFYEALSYSEEDYDLFYSGNHSEFDVIDYKFIEITAQYNSDMSNADTALSEAKKQPRSLRIK